MKSTKMHLFSPGHAGCPGCGPSNAMIQITDAISKVVGKDFIVVNATGCMEITSSLYPRTAWRVPYIHSLFENTPAVASGVSRALKAKGNNHTKVIVIAGDGGTYDIGFGALSGMLERNEDVLYICYDNELYANTGVQKSGATPYGATTTTTPNGTIHHGKERERKPLVEITAMHNIPYAASTSIAFTADLELKIKKALNYEGSKVIVVHAPCCLGAGFDGAITIELARLAVQTRLWFLFEIEKGKLKLNMKVEDPKPVEEYLLKQNRFKHLSKEQIMHIQKQANENYEKLKKLAEFYEK